MTRLSGPGQAAEGAPETRELFATTREVALCCVDRLAALPLGGRRMLAATSCSSRGGTWLWTQAVTATGAPLEPPAPVLPLPGRAQHAPRLVASPDEGAWLVWIEGEEDPFVGGAVRAARLDDRGEIVRGPFALSNALDTLAKSDMVVDGLAAAALPGGGLAVAWLAVARTGPRAIQLRLFDSAGLPVTDETRATPPDHEDVESPRLHPLDGGGLAVVWQRKDPDRSRHPEPSRVFLRIFSGDGEALSAPLPVASDEPGRSQGSPRIIASDGVRLLAWHEWKEERRGSGEGWIALRRWHPERGPVGLTTRFPVAIGQRWPFLEVAAEDDGHLTVFWHTGGPRGFAEAGRIAWRRVLARDR